MVTCRDYLTDSHRSLEVEGFLRGEADADKRLRQGHGAYGA